MKMCPNCRNQIADEAVYCPICGSGVGAAPTFESQNPQQSSVPYNTSYTQQPVYAPPVPYIDPYDHTSEFDAADISENKVIAMVVYLLGPLGILIALLASNTSKYAAFHVRQALKLTVVEILASLALVAFGFVTALIGLEEFGAFVAVLVVFTILIIQVICFLQVCKGKAKEAYFVRKLAFLK